jgi:phenylacetate-CoA ligase
MDISANFYQPEIERMPYDEMRALQDKRLSEQVAHVYGNVEYYRRLMDERGVAPGDVKSVDDLHKLPFLTKDDLREAYPYGLLAVPLRDAVRIQSTSGTTGKRVVAF